MLYWVGVEDHVVYNSTSVSRYQRLWLIKEPFVFFKKYFVKHFFKEHKMQTFSSTKLLKVFVDRQRKENFTGVVTPRKVMSLLDSQPGITTPKKMGQHYPSKDTSYHVLATSTFFERNLKDM